MKQVSLLLLATVFSFGAVKAQGEMDAYKYSRNDLTGTARSVAMGGAFGALGGDISGISINPAGIGIYRNSEIVTTLNFQNTKTETESNLGKIDDSKFKFNFDNLAFVSVFPLNSDVAPSLNVGFSYNRLKNFERKYSMRGNPTGTIADYMAQRATNDNVGSPSDLWWGDQNYDPFHDSNYDWMGIFGYSSFLIGQKNGTNSTYERQGILDGKTINNDLAVYERGSINTYDFNVGTTFADVISWGLTLSVTDIDYRMSSRYSEDFYNSSNVNGGFDLFNGLKTEGTGWQVSTGIIVKPIDELRFGVSYHSPTWYNMTDTYDAQLDYDFSNYLPSEKFNTGNIYTGVNVFDYDFRSPDRWTFSLAGIIGQTAIISADYELTNYQNMKMFEDNGRNLVSDPNPYIKQDFRMSSTLRLGAEVRVTPQFSVRAGYSWVQSPLKADFKDNSREVMTVGTVSNYVLDGETNYITYGLGYRFSKNFYTDIAFLMRSQKSDLYSYYGSEKSTWKDNTFQGLMTFGYRF